MLDSAVAFIRDVDLFEQIQRQVGGQFGTEVRFAGTADGALDHLRGQRVPTLLFDSRVDHCDPEAHALIDGLASRGPEAVNLVTVGDESYPRTVAATLDLLGICHLPLRAGGPQFDRTREELHRVFTAVRARQVPRPQRVEAGGIGVATYTPEFFPIIDDLLRVAHRDVTLLLVGETGTGKTTLARFIHNRSARRDRPFQHLACGALPADLIESELFGHTRGAFTGAERNKIGRFQAAGHGTLLLDEIDVLDLKQQVKLLKVIETGEYEMVGSTETRLSEARLIVASNVNLEEMIAKAQFRTDLYYRLNVLEFRLPALRDRPLDIVPLAMQFADESCREHNIAADRVHRGFLDALRRYRWPGNLRELKNHVRRAVLFCSDGRLTPGDLSPRVTHSPPEGGNGLDLTGPRGWTLADRVARNERELLEQALRANDNNRTRTARALGLSRVGLYKKLRRLGLMEVLEPAGS
jgi:DNA-binding NtrC family response regulator